MFPPNAPIVMGPDARRCKPGRDCLPLPSFAVFSNAATEWKRRAIRDLA